MSDRDLSYAICATPRSGSNLLCDLLETSRLMGHPKEILNIRSMVIPFARERDLLEDGGALDLAVYLAEVKKTYSTGNGAFGMKLLIEQLKPFSATRAMRAFLGDARFIWLIRRDIVAQAVSAYVARATRRWVSLAGSASETAQSVSHTSSALPYDGEKIGRLINSIASQNGQWLEFFSANRRDFKMVTYEELVTDPDRVCREICEYCGVETDHRFMIENARFMRQSAKVNEELIARVRYDSSVRLREGRTNSEITVAGLAITVA